MNSLPLAVTIGFSGPRTWFSHQDYPDISLSDFQNQVVMWLTSQMASLRTELGLTENHFFTGISQIAIGADHAFTSACRDLGIPQIISLPQPSDAYLDARGESTADFSPEEKRQSLALLASPHIIQERVVSNSADRYARFEETNVELVRQSDIIIAMVKPDTTGKRGGTWDVIDLANRRDLPVLVVTVSVENHLPIFTAAWAKKDAVLLPKLPQTLSAVACEEITSQGIPTKDAYFGVLKNHCSKEADRFSKSFQSAARMIIGTHFIATVCAVTALLLWKGYFAEPLFYSTLAALLLLELFLLVKGYRIHHTLHRNEAASRWAMNRLLSEIARSAIAFGKYHVGFDHLWQLNIPETIHPLLRTMEILQLRETRTRTCDDWQDCRNAYLAKRLVGPKAQIEFYATASAKAKHQYHTAHRIFTFASRAAIAATGFKLILVIVVALSAGHLHPDLWKALLGFFGVLFPVVAVAALSLAAANDLEARAHTFSEMHTFLLRQAELLENATSEREFSQLLTETESRLLGETVTWFSRRSFTGVA